MPRTPVMNSEAVVLHMQYVDADGEASDHFVHMSSVSTISMDVIMGEQELREGFLRYVGGQDKDRQTDRDA